MSKFTPGPWAVFHDHPNPETAKSLAYIRAADGSTRYEFGFSEIACCFGCKTPEQAANARLIAAAPELLEAHKAGEIVEALFVELTSDGRLDVRNPHVQELCAAFVEYREFRRAAIAKATGETP